MSEVSNPITIGQYLEGSITVGEPDVSGSLAVYPLFGPEPRQEYLSLARAHGQGFMVKELAGGASVRDLIVGNPLATPVLLFEGEEVLGAQQNRTLDKSVLVPAGAEVRVPVSCVEAGRWDGSRHSEHFQPAPQAAHPDLRREKARQSSRARHQGLEERADQGRVWESVSLRASQMNVDSSTGAMHDIYENRREPLRELSAAIELHPNQIGALVAIGGEIRVLDLVSRPDVFEDLHKPLVQGYSLDALAAGKAKKVDADVKAAKTFIEGITTTRILEADGIGLGRDFRFESPKLVGAGLIAGEELIQLSVFAGEEDGSSGSPFHVNHNRIRRPSMRRL